MRICWLAKKMAISSNVASKLTTEISHLESVSINRYAEKLLANGLIISDPYGTGLKFDNSAQKLPNDWNILSISACIFKTYICMQLLVNQSIFTTCTVYKQSEPQPDLAN